MLKTIILAFLVLVSPTTFSVEPSVPATENVITYFREHLDCLTKAIYYEARGEGYKGMLAVAHVVVNRTKSPKYPDDICSVIYQRNQFSWTQKPPKIVSHHIFDQAREIAYRVLSGETKDPTKGAVSFHSTAVDPEWNKKPKIIIGNHIFY